MESRVFTHSELSNYFSDTETLDAIIKKIEMDSAANGLFVCRVWVNGLQLSESEEVRFRESKLSDINEIKVEASDINSLVRDTLVSTYNLARELDKKTSDLAEMFRQKDLHPAHLSFKVLAESIDSLAQAWNLVQETSAVLNESFKVKAQEIALNLNKQLSDLLDAYQRRDFILTADILEYEIARLLQEMSNVAEGVIDKTSEVGTHIEK